MPRYRVAISASPIMLSGIEAASTTEAEALVTADMLTGVWPVQWIIKAQEMPEPEEVATDADARRHDR